MIFVTVGGQMPFDRLVRAVDNWLANEELSINSLFQIGSGEYVPKFGEWCRHMDSDEFRKCLARCQLVIAHAGMGTILTALELSKPIIVFPRRAYLMETRNDHQLSTAFAMKERGLVQLATSESGLARLLDLGIHSRPSEHLSPWASDDLLDAIDQFICASGVANRLEVRD